MSTKKTIKQGSTGYIDVVLYKDGTAWDLSTIDHLELVIDHFSRKQSLYDIGASPNLFITGAATGEVQIRPNTDTFELSGIHKMFFWVYTTSTIKYPNPSSGRLWITVEENA